MSRSIFLKAVSWLWIACLGVEAAQAEPPEVLNVQASQRTDGSRLVDIYYDVSDPDSPKLKITIAISDNNGASYTIIPTSLSGDVGLVTPGIRKHIVWNAGQDLPGVYGDQYRAAVTADDEVPDAGGLIVINLPNLPAGAKPLEMVWIPAGTYRMGSPVDEPDRWDDEGPQRQVTLTRPFYMGKYEITQAQWQAVMGNNPSYFGGNNHPVERVSWNDAQAFIQKLNQLGQGTFRLPTEAEWEYACRAGTSTRYYWGDDLDYSQIGNYAWYQENSSYQTQDVGMKLPNAWGLHDMSGNVWEWCQDWYGAYSTNQQVDPVGAASGTDRVLRGGGWGDLKEDCRSACRYWYKAGEADDYIGLRVVLIPELSES